MAEYRDDETEWPDRPAIEGVRILGAEEARAVVGSDAETGDVGPTAPAPSSARPSPPGAPPVRLDTEASRYFGGAEDDFGSWGDETGGVAVRPDEAPVLPHWTEPPTGEVPRIAVEDAELFDVQAGDEADLRSEEDLEAWSGFAQGAPRYRDHAADWAEADFVPGDDLLGHAEALGGVSEPIDEVPLADAVAELRGVALAPPLPVEDLPVAQLEPDEPVRSPGLAMRPDGGGRDMGVAVATGGVLAAVALGVFSLGRGPAAWLVAAIVTLAAGEVYGEIRKRGYQPATLLGLVGCASITLAAYWKGEGALPILIALVVGFTPLWYLATVVRARATVNMALTLFVFATIGVTGSFGGLLLGHPDGIGILVGLVVCVAAHDVAGLFVGSRIGSRKIAPRVSPNKTLEGLLGGMAAALVTGFLVAGRIAPWDGGSGLWLGLCVAVAAPVGDLCESMLKRDLGVKDIGGLLPGHGGVLDRFDGILYSLPVVYYLVRILEIGS